MNERTARQFEEVESRRAKLLQRVCHLNEEEFRRSPGEGSWSVSQVLAHLILAERLSLDYMTKKIQDPSQLKSPSMIDAVKSRMLTVALRSPGRFTSPPAAANPPADGDLGTLREEWDEVRSAWKAFISDYPEELQDRAIYRHPVAGPMTLEQCQRFVDEHIRHHAQQVERIIAAIK